MEFELDLGRRPRHLRNRASRPLGRHVISQNDNGAFADWPPLVAQAFSLPTAARAAPDRASRTIRMSSKLSV
jgi:hypothetical protein